MEQNQTLEAIRTLLEQGDTHAALSGLLDTVAALTEEVEILSVQLETLLDTLGEDEETFEEDCSYVVTCSCCGCVMEVESWLLEDPDAQLSCPECHAVLEL